MAGHDFECDPFVAFRRNFLVFPYIRKSPVLPIRCRSFFSGRNFRGEDRLAILQDAPCAPHLQMVAMPMGDEHAFNLLHWQMSTHGPGWGLEGRKSSWAFLFATQSPLHPHGIQETSTPGQTQSLAQGRYRLTSNKMYNFEEMDILRKVKLSKLPWWLRW